jgi:hypothetical protein
MGLFMADVLDDALSELSKLEETADPEELFEQMRLSEDSDYKKFSEAPLSPQALNFPIPDDIRQHADIFRDNNVCHTARLPAEARHLGYVTESKQVGFSNYDKGNIRGEYDQNRKVGGLMELVQEGEQYSPQQQCPIPVQVDYKDYFYAHQAEDWKWLVVPNDKEMEVYVPPGYTLKGIIMICFAVCNWGKCPAGNLLAPDLELDKGEMLINNIPTKMTGIDATCGWARHADGHIFAPNSEGRFNISARAIDTNSYFRISSIIVW